MQDVQLADQIERLIEAGQEYVGRYNLNRTKTALRRRQQAPGTPAELDWGEEGLEEREAERSAARAAVAAAEPLPERLIAIGEDPRLLLIWADHVKAMSDEASTLWPEVKAHLQSVTLRLRAPESQTEPDKAAEPPKPTAPMWQRLEVLFQHGGNDLVRLDGHEYRVSWTDATFLQHLQSKCGEMVLGRTLKDATGTRSDRIYERLPDPVKRIVSKPGKTGRGYRML